MRNSLSTFEIQLQKSTSCQLFRSYRLDACSNGMSETKTKFQMRGNAFRGKSGSSRKSWSSHTWKSLLTHNYVNDLHCIVYRQDLQ